MEVIFEITHEIREVGSQGEKFKVGGAAFVMILGKERACVGEVRDQCGWNMRARKAMWGETGHLHAVLKAICDNFILSEMESHWKVFNRSVVWSDLHFYKIVLAIVLKMAEVK